MASSEIINYIKKQRDLNVSDEIIRSKLASVGWIQEDVDNAFSDLKREDKISIINSNFEKEKSVPTSQTSGYTKDPYHEPIGQGRPEAASFIKEEVKPEMQTSRTWSKLGDTSENKSEAPRQGQRFAPVYKAVPMEEHDENKNLIPELQKAEASFVGTSFVPKKAEANIPVQNNFNSTENTSYNNVNQSVPALRVMPSGINDLPKGDLLQNDLSQIMKEQKPRGNNHIFGWIIFIIIFFISIFGVAIFASTKGYIDLPFSIDSFLNTKQEANVVEEEVFVPKIEDNSMQNTAEEDTNLNSQKILKNEDSLFTDIETEGNDGNNLDVKNDEVVKPTQENNPKNIQ